MLHEHSHGGVSDRRLFSLAVAGPDEVPSRLALPAGNFVCLLAWDARKVPDRAVIELATRLLGAGACYFVCWGPDCERVHDLIDDVICAAEAAVEVLTDSVIMTTWHDTEPLDEAIFYFLINTWPAEDYEESTHSALAIILGSPLWAAEVAAALDEPHEFIARGSTMT